MKPIGYGIKYMVRHHLLRRQAPLICGLVLTNKCNLRCRHCKIPNASHSELQCRIEICSEKRLETPPGCLCRVRAGEKCNQCCRYSGDPELCRNCGYLSYAEIDQALKLKPSAILRALKYF